jgi:SAM-dependent methyltransferase
MAVSRDEVLNAYRYILGREPESEAVVEQHMRGNADLAALRRQFLGSPEAASLMRPPPPPTLPLIAAPLEVEHSTDPETLTRVVALTGRYWARIGEEAPHWSVLTADEFRPDRIAETEAAFYETGRGDLDILTRLLRRIGRDPAGFRCVAEYGCGVGRLTTHLADVYPEVKALDISRPHLELAHRWLAQRGQKNVSLQQVTPQDLHPGGGFDLWWCRIVLQHNPPPVMVAVLDRMLRLLEPGGVAVFQLPVHRVGYRFRVADYLNRDLGSEMEMHVLPQKVVLDLLWKHRCRLADLREDTWVVSQSPDWLSNTFVVEKD